MILCFWVISFHCLNNNSINYFVFYLTKTKFHHVPCFSFISFFYVYTIFIERNISKFKKRLERLLIPYIIWPLIILIINNIFHLLFNSEIKPIFFKDLLIQIIIGRQFMIPLWLLFGIIFLSVLLFILINILKKYFLFISQLLIILSYIIQYSNKLVFLNKFKYNVRLPVLDTFSIFPLSLIGLNFASLNIMDDLKSHSKKILFFGFLFIFILFKYEVIIDLGGYNGIIHIFTSLLFFVCFYLLPLDKTYI